MIEIMIGLLGVMIAVLTLIFGLLAIFLAVMGFFGFKSIKDEAKRIARNIAEAEARATIRSEVEKLEAIDYTATLGDTEEPASAPPRQPQGGRKLRDIDLKGKKQ